MGFEPNTINLSKVEEDKGDFEKGPYSIHGENGLFHFSLDDLSTHTLFLGSTGTGKTNVIFHLLRLIKDHIMTSNDALVIFDTKGDYLSEFYDHQKGDMVISNLGEENQNKPNSPQYRRAIWNIFMDIAADGEQCIDQNANEIARSMNEDMRNQSKDPFWPLAASDVTRSAMIALLRKKAQKTTNADIVNTLGQGTAAEIRELLKGHEDLRGTNNYIPEDSKQTLSVMAYIQSIMSDIFLGEFSKPGNFSIRDFIKQKGGKALFIEYDPKYGRILTPIYRMLIDLAIKESLGRAKNIGNVYFVIDEFALLPNLYHIDDGINFGRQQNVKFIIGTQNVSQIIESYGQGRGKSLLSNIGIVFAFRLNDEESKTLVKSRYGEYTTCVPLIPLLPGTQGGESIPQQLQNANIITDSDLSMLPNGKAIICKSGKPPRAFQFKRYKSTSKTQAMNIQRYSTASSVQQSVSAKSDLKNTNECPQCGSQTKPSDKMCRSCGKLLR